MTDITKLADRLRFIGASVPYPWSEQVNIAADMLIQLRDTGNRLAELLEDNVADNTASTADDATAALTEWGNL